MAFIGVPCLSIIMKQANHGTGAGNNVEPPQRLRQSGHRFRIGAAARALHRFSCHAARVTIARRGRRGSRIAQNRRCLDGKSYQEKSRPEGRHWHVLTTLHGSPYRPQPAVGLPYRSLFVVYFRTTAIGAWGTDVAWPNGGGGCDVCLLPTQNGPLPTQAVIASLARHRDETVFAFH
jgi:hypothetical protein